MGTLSGDSLYSLLGATVLHDERIAFHKVIEIKGFFGENWQKGRLSFLSLLKQIGEGRDKGCSVKEIVNAVLRTINLDCIYEVCLKCA